MALKKPLFTFKRSVGWAKGGAPFGRNRIIFRRPWIGGSTGPTPEIGPAIIFDAPFTHSLIPSVAINSAYTFSRVSNGGVSDFEDLVNEGYKIRIERPALEIEVQNLTRISNETIINDKKDVKAEKIKTKREEVIL